MNRGLLVLLVASLLSGCSATRVVRLDTGEGTPIVHRPRMETPPVELGSAEFKDTIRELARTTPVSGSLQENSLRSFENALSPRAPYQGRARLGLISVEHPQRGRLLVADEPAENTKLESDYGRWCQRRGPSRDCLNLLTERHTLDEEGKRTLAFRIALDSVWDETEEALKGMTDRDAMMVMLVSTGAIYFGLWLLPEPLSKGIAAVITVGLISYLGWDTVWSLIQGWRVLDSEVRAATHFHAISDAGERYGKVMGRNAARVFVMLAAAALGSTAQSLAGKLPTLPGSAQASMVGAEQAGLRLASAGQVVSVAVAPGGVVTVGLAPGAVMASEPVDSEGHEHHIASNKWWTSPHQGGPWSPRLKKLFDRAGMSLDDAANKVRVKGHKGPHPREYHEEVFERLREATQTCRTVQQCREALVAELRRLAIEIITPGSHLHKLVTRSP